MYFGKKLSYARHSYDKYKKTMFFYEFYDILLLVMKITKRNAKKGIPLLEGYLTTVRAFF